MIAVPFYLLDMAFKVVESSDQTLVGTTVTVGDFVGECKSSLWQDGDTFVLFRREEGVHPNKWPFISGPLESSHA